MKILDKKTNSLLKSIRSGSQSPSLHTTFSLITILPFFCLFAFFLFNPVNPRPFPQSRESIKSNKHTTVCETQTQTKYFAL